MSSVLTIRQIYRLSRQRSNTLGTGGNHGVRRGVACRTPFVDDIIVFAIFLAVCSLPQHSAPFLSG